jgi:DNA-binding response OmpR family regulator
MSQITTKKILVVDDEENIREIIAEGLSVINNVDIFQACDGEDAILKLNEHDIDVLITDVIMPKKDGFELLHHVNESYKKEIVTFVCTGYVDEDSFKKLNIHKVIAKPFDLDFLINEVEMICNNT